MRKLGCIAVFLLCCSTPALGQFVIDDKMPDWGIQFDEVHATLSRDLLDPRSAQYKGMFLTPVANGNVLCGWMNWRNEMGGYAPFVPFAYAAFPGGVRESMIGRLDDDKTLASFASLSKCDEHKLKASRSDLW